MSGSDSDSDPLALIHAILAREEIDLQHTDASLAEAQAALADPGLDDAALTDWSTLPFVTIDNSDSRDLDQALLIERESADYRVRYALADAAWYVRPGSALFAESLLRGASFYTPLADSAHAAGADCRKTSCRSTPRSHDERWCSTCGIAADGSVLGTSVVRARDPESGEDSATRGVQ